MSSENLLRGPAPSSQGISVSKVVAVLGAAAIGAAATYGLTRVGRRNELDTCVSSACTEAAAHILAASRPLGDVCNDAPEALCGRWEYENPLGEGQKADDFSFSVAGKQVDIERSRTVAALTCDTSIAAFSDDADGLINASGCQKVSCETLGSSDAAKAEGFKAVHDALKHAGILEFVKSLPKNAATGTAVTEEEMAASIRSVVTQATPFADILFGFSLIRMPLKNELALRLIESGIDSYKVHYGPLDERRQKRISAHKETVAKLFNSFKSALETLKVADVDGGIEVPEYDAAELADIVFAVQDKLFANMSERIYLGQNMTPYEFAYAVGVKDGEALVNDALDLGTLLKNVREAEGTGDAIPNGIHIVSHNFDFFKKAPTAFASPRELEVFTLYRVLSALAGPAGLDDMDCNELFTSPEQPLAWPVDYKYISEHREDADERRNAVSTMIEHIIAAFKDRVPELKWMSEVTKKRAIEKASKVTVRVGYPHFLENSKAMYDKVTGISLGYTSPSDIAAAVPQNKGETIVTGAFAAAVDIHLRRRRVLSMITVQPNTAPDSDVWGMLPSTINAYYNPEQNEMVYPHAIFQSPFYHKMDFRKGDTNGGQLAKLALNYGSIGAVAGHELTHGFDNTGAYYDAAGNYINWWTQEDEANFENMNECLIQQYNSFKVPQISEIYPDAHHVDGENTLGENIADSGGLRLAYRGFQKHIASDPALKALYKRLGNQDTAFVEVEETNSTAFEITTEAQEVGLSATVTKLIAPLFPFNDEMLLPGINARPNRLFYTAFAQNWCRQFSNDEWKNRLLTDVHAPAVHRIIGGLRNSDTSREAFGCAKKYGFASAAHADNVVSELNLNQCVIW